MGHLQGSEAGVLDQEALHQASEDMDHHHHLDLEDQEVLVALGGLGSEADLPRQDMIRTGVQCRQEVCPLTEVLLRLT